jgi:3-hydroxypropionyl-CoA synthetase (ADP-forming)
VAICSNGAGPVVAAVDHFDRANLSLADISASILKIIKKHFSPTYIVGKKGNPIDITGGATADDYRFIIQQFYDEKNVDIIMSWFAFQDEPLEETIIDYLDKFSKKRTKPLLVGCNGGPYTQKISKLLEEKEIPVYDDIRTWVAAASALAQWGSVRGSK